MDTGTQQIVLGDILPRKPAETDEIRVCFNRHCHERGFLRRTRDPAANNADYKKPANLPGLIVRLGSNCSRSDRITSNPSGSRPQTSTPSFQDGGAERIVAVSARPSRMPCTSASIPADPSLPLPKLSRATTTPSPGDAARYGVDTPSSHNATAMPVASTAVS